MSETLKLFIFMKSHILLFCFMLSAITTFAADKTVKLPQPDMTRKGTVMTALENRKSTREFSDRELSLQDLADLLWAANGVNREDGRRTAPTAMNRQDIDLYAVFPEGTYLYNAGEHSLELVSEDDARKDVAGQQDFVLSAPVCLVIVSDYDKMGDAESPRVQMMCAVDAGIVSQNISIFCASAGLATVARASMNVESLKKVLKLRENQHPVMNHPVGYFK